VLVVMASAHEAIDSNFRTEVQVWSDGRCKWTPLGIFISSCAIDIRWFPFDDQRCAMKFGSWTYDGTKLNLTFSAASVIEQNIFVPSSEWDLVGRSALHIAFCRECTATVCCIASVVGCCGSCRRCRTPRRVL